MQLIESDIHRNGSKVLEYYLAAYFTQSEIHTMYYALRQIAFDSTASKILEELREAFPDLKSIDDEKPKHPKGLSTDED